MNLTAELLAPDISALIKDGAFSELRAALHGIPPADIADILASLEPADAALGFRFLQRDDAADAFAYLAPEVQQRLISELGAEGSVRVIEAMSGDDRAKLLDELPEAVCQRVVASLSPETRATTQAILGYPPRTVGRLMTPDYIRIKPEWTVAQSLDHIRR
ncbi:MAG: magnesium transporter MgtE N-terminal domain-containing protein, partial [Phycisphaerae bacterium]